MNQLQSARMANAKSVLRMMDDYAAYWNHRKPIVEKVNGIRPLVAALETGDTKQRNADPKAFTGRKQAAFATMRTTTFRTAMKLRDLAGATQDTVLYQAVDFTLAQVEAATQLEQLSTARLILSKAKDAVAQLADYEITPESLTLFESQINRADELSIDRTMVNNHHRVTTEEIAADSKNLSAQLTALDSLLEGFDSENDAPFVSAYRKIRDGATRHTSTATSEAGPKAKKAEVKG